MLLLSLPVLAENAQHLVAPLPGLYRYLSATGDGESFFIWKLAWQNNHVMITVNDYHNDRFMVNRCEKNGETIDWHLKEKENTEIKATRNGNTIHIFGTKEGSVFDQTFTIDPHPWYQPLSFSLTEFLFSDQEAIRFWSIRQDTIELVSLEAKKIGFETVAVKDQDIPAFKVEIRLTGFLSPFWHSTYWYSRENGQFLQYRAVIGPPGTTETTISLVGKLGG